MFSKASAVLHHGDVVGVTTDGIIWISPLSERPRNLIRAHPNNRGVILISGDYKMPKIISIAELKAENYFSSPDIIQKTPEIGDRVAYYPGNGDFAVRWAMGPQKKPPLASKAMAA